MSVPVAQADRHAGDRAVHAGLPTPAPTILGSGEPEAVEVAGDEASEPDAGSGLDRSPEQDAGTEHERSPEADAGARQDRDPDPSSEPPPEPAPEPLPTVVLAGDAWAEAGRTVLRVQLGRMLARVDGVLAGEDPEEVHVMRVAARRMRAAWRLFGDGFERDARRRYVGDLRAVGRTLGVVRDRDVLLELLAAHQRRTGRREARALDGLADAWRADRAAGHLELVAMLRSPDFGAFSAEYSTLVETPGLAALPPNGPAHVRDRLPSRVWAAYEEVWAYDDGIADAEMARLHRLRIAGKWLRYTIEFAREALKPESAALIAPVVDLQDRIGEMHDLHVAAAAARDWLTASGPGPAERRAVERYAALADERAERRRRHLRRTWAPLAASEYRRRLGRALARL